MWTIGRIILIIAFFTLPGWAFFLVLGLFLYFGFYKSIQRKQANNGAIALPTWFSKENYDHIQRKSGKKYQKAAEIVLRTGAELQSSKKKRKQTIIHPTFTQPIMDNDPNLQYAKQASSDYSAHQNHDEHKNISDYDNAIETPTYHCSTCDLDFTGRKKQACHLSNCPYIK